MQLTYAVICHQPLTEITDFARLRLFAPLQIFDRHLQDNQCKMHTTYRVGTDADKDPDGLVVMRRDEVARLLHFQGS